MAPDRPPIVWSPEALGDIDQIWGYYAGVAGRSPADKILREIARVVAAIGDFPFAGGHVTKSGQVSVLSPLRPMSSSID